MFKRALIKYGMMTNTLNQGKLHAMLFDGNTVSNLFDWITDNSPVKKKITLKEIISRASGRGQTMVFCWNGTSHMLPPTRTSKKCIHTPTFRLEATKIVECNIQHIFLKIPVDEANILLHQFSEDLIKKYWKNLDLNFEE